MDRLRSTLATSAAYRILGTVAGLGLGWLPLLVHGPIPEKLSLVRLNGSLAVWCYYTARLSIGFWVANTTWPASWWRRGPVCGLLAMLPPGFLALATPGCGFT